MYVTQKCGFEGMIQDFINEIKTFYIDAGCERGGVKFDTIIQIDLIVLNGEIIKRELDKFDIDIIVDKGAFALSERSKILIEDRWRLKD